MYKVEEGTQALLDHIGVINHKYEQLNKTKRFNIFEVLHKSSDEVNVHS